MGISLRKRFVYAVSLTVFAALAATAYASDRGKNIKLKDDCDPATFNDVLGPGACIGHGETTFADFIGQVFATGAADEWEFDPDETKEKAGRSVNGRNEGGETHSFTPVKKFGGGFVDVLNQGKEPLDECAAKDENGDPIPNPEEPGTFFPAPSTLGTFVPAGTNGPAMKLEKGVNRFQCCIHPWMRTTIVAK